MSLRVIMSCHTSLSSVIFRYFDANHERQQTAVLMYVASYVSSWSTFQWKQLMGSLICRPTCRENCQLMEWLNFLRREIFLDKNIETVQVPMEQFPQANYAKHLEGDLRWHKKKNVCRRCGDGTLPFNTRTMGLGRIIQCRFTMQTVVVFFFQRGNIHDWICERSAVQKQHKRAHQSNELQDG